MKHIEKKYLFQRKNVKDRLRSIGKEVKLTDVNLSEKSNNHAVYVVTDKEITLRATVCKNNGEEFIIPLPDLTLVYFDAAYNLNQIRKDQQIRLYEKTKTGKEINEDATNEIYKFYGFSSSCIIMLFTSLESYLNHFIPDNGKYIDETNSKTVIYNKNQIQRAFGTIEKIEKIYPFFFTKNFGKIYPNSLQIIKELKSMRDDIVHSKSTKEFEPQEKLIQNLLNFDIMETMQAIKELFNYYHDNYLLECKCGIDY